MFSGGIISSHLEGISIFSVYTQGKGTYMYKLTILNSTSEMHTVSNTEPNLFS